METTERIVEAYVRYIKGWATIPNIRCAGQYEIDLLAIDPVNLNRYHIEVGVSISNAFSKLTAKPFSREELKQRSKMPSLRRTIGYFIERKFNVPEVIETLQGYGYRDDYGKIVVSWSWAEVAEQQAKDAGITLWDFRKMIQEIGERFKRTNAYFTDDTLRTLQLFAKTLG